MAAAETVNIDVVVRDTNGKETLDRTKEQIRQLGIAARDASVLAAGGFEGIDKAAASSAAAVERSTADQGAALARLASSIRSAGSTPGGGSSFTDALDRVQRATANTAASFQDIPMAAESAFGAVNDGAGTAAEALDAATEAAGGLADAMGSVQEPAESAQESFLSMMTKADLVSRAVDFVTNGIKNAVGAGMDRLTTIQDASTALRVQFGGDMTKTKTFMDSILAVVKGTPFNLDQFATAGKNLVAFGTAAEKVPGYLTALGEAAAASGKGAESVDYMVDSFGKMQVAGQATNDALNSMEAQGVPATQILANAMNKTTTDIQDMVSNGAIPATKAMDILRDGIVNGSEGIAGPTVKFGGSMAALRTTFNGAMGGMNASVARLGANMLQPWLDTMSGGLVKISDILDKIGALIAPWSQRLADAFHGALDWLINAGTAVASVMTWLGPFGTAIDGLIISLGLLILVNFGGFIDTIRIRIMLAADAVVAAGGIMRWTWASVAAAATAAWKAMGGWIGLGITAVITALSFFIGRTGDAARETVDFTDVIDKNTGGLVKNAAALLANNDKVMTSARAYVAAGGAAGDWSKAVTGDPDAIKRVNNVLYERALATTKTTDSFRVYNLMNQDATLTEEQFAKGIVDGTVAFDTHNEALNNIAGSSAELRAQTADLNGQMGVQKSNAEEATAAVDKHAAATMSDKEAADQAKEATKQWNQAWDDAKTAAEDVVKHNPAETAFRDIQSAADDAAHHADLFMIKIDELSGRSRSADELAADTANAIIATEKAFEEGLAKAEYSDVKTDKKGKKTGGELTKEAGSLDVKVLQAFGASGKGSPEELHAVAELQKGDSKGVYDALVAEADQRVKNTEAVYSASIAADKAAGVTVDYAKATKLATDTQQASREEFIKHTTEMLKGALGMDGAKLAATQLADKLGVVDGSKLDPKILDISADDAATQAVKDIEAMKIGDKSFAILTNPKDAYSQAAELNAALKTAGDKSIQYAVVGSTVYKITNNAQQIYDNTLAHLGRTMDGNAVSADNLAVTQADVDEAYKNLVETGTHLQDSFKQTADNAGASADQAYRLAVQNGNLSGAVDSATAVMEAQRVKFIDSQVAAGMEKTAAEQLANQIGLIPGDVTTKYKAENLLVLQGQVETLNATVRAIDGSTVTYKIQGESIIATGPGIPLISGSQNKADGGLLTGPGTGRSDSILVRASNGEFVVNAASTARNLPLLEHINSSYADGGLVHSTALYDYQSLAKNVSLGGAMADSAVAVKAAMAKLFTSAGGAAYTGSLSGGVEQWRTLALSALAMTGESLSNIGALLHQMQTESGGNPNAINLTDINAQRGDPSIGLMQVIGSTFRNALAGSAFSYLIAAGQRNPFANIVASILYARGRYGSLANAYRGVAYDEGGVWPSGTAGVNTSGHDELVLTHQQVAGMGKTVTVSQGAVQIVVQGNLSNAGQVRAELEQVLRDILSEDDSRRL